jgi:hypothetical protein
MALTRPKAAQINFDLTNISDPVIRLNSDKTDANDTDVGFIFERGSTGDNAVLVWDESADAFVMGTTTATGASTGDLTIANGELRLDTLRIDQSGSGLRMTNVGAFDNDGSDNFRIFATNDLKIAANGDSGTAITIDATNQDVTITNDLRVTAGQFYYGGTAVTSTATELNYLDGITGITLGTANELLVVGGDGSSIVSDSTLAVDTGNNRLGINQSSPEVTLHMTGEGPQTAQIRMEQYNDTADAPDLRTRRYRGTIASPSAISSGDYLYRSNHEYWNGSALIVGGTFAFDNTNDANRTQFAVSVTTDGTSADAATPSKVQLKIDGNDSGSITFNNAYKFPTADGSANQVLQTDGSGALSFATVNTSAIDNVVEDTTPQLGGNLDGQAFNITTTGTITYGTLNDGTTALTSTVAELNILDGVTATTAELNYVDGVTSNIQTQIDNISSSFTLSDNQGTPNTDTFTTGQTLTFAGSTGIDTSVSDNQVAIAIDSTVATLTGTQTLTNKTINSASNTITITESDISDLGSYITASSTDTLTNKTLTTPVISSISNTGTLTLPTSTDTLVGRATTDTLTNKTLTSPTVGTNLDLSARAPVQFYDGDSSNYIGLRAPSSVASNYTFTLPAQDGTSQQVIVTDGAGNWSFANQSGGGGASGFQSSTLNTHPAASDDEDLATGPSDDTVETPFETSGIDSFGVSLGSVYDQMEPIGSTTTTDLGDSEAYVGA